MLEPLLHTILFGCSLSLFVEALPPDCDRGLFVTWQEGLQQLWRRLNALQSAKQHSRHRISLDVFEVGICIAAVRAAMRTKGRSNVPFRVPKTPAARRRRAELLRRLENYQRQLRRRFQREWDNPKGCARLLYQFSLYHKALVHELFRPRSVLPTGLRRVERQLFPTLVTMAEEGLKEIGDEIPPARELRSLVSQWLRNVRLSRVAVAYRDLLNDPTVGEPYLVEFVGRRWARMVPGRAEA